MNIFGLGDLTVDKCVVQESVPLQAVEVSGGLCVVSKEEKANSVVMMDAE